MRSAGATASLVVLGLVAFSCAEGSSFETEAGADVGGGSGGASHGSATSGPGSAGPSGSGSSSASGTGGAVGSGGGGGAGGGAGSSSGGAGAGGSGGAIGSGGAGGAGAGGAGAGGAGGGGGALGCVIYSEPFSGCPGNFTSSGVKNDWQCGVPSGAAGPPGDHTTGNGSLWGTNIAGTTNTCEDAELVSPAVDLAPYAGKTILLSFWHWFDFRGCTPNGILCPQFACQVDTSSYSGGVVEVFANGNWVQIHPMGGYGNGGQKISCSYMDAACTSCSLEGKTGFSAAGMEGVWQEAVLDLSAYASAMSQVRFKYASHDAYSCYPKTGGWYIDDVEVKTVEACP